MDPSRLVCKLVLADGPSRRVGAAGVWIGRQGDCDLVTADPAASRRHALVRLTSEGVELVALGREPTVRNGKPVERAILGEGDVIGVPGLTVTVTIEAAAPATHAGLALVRERGGSFGISHTPFVIGGAASADLILKGWPEEPVLRVHLVQGEPYLELCTGDAQLGDAALEVGALEPLAIGDRVLCRGEAFTIAAARGAVTTAVGARQELPKRVEIELLPRGGRVSFALPSGERRVYLADRRLDLIMALLKPPAGHQPGEFIPDDAVRGVVWPRNPSVSRQEINTLIARCRRDLVDAGLAGPHLIERAPGGGGTRFVLAPNAEIVVKT